MQEKTLQLAEGSTVEADEQGSQNAKSCGGDSDGGSRSQNPGHEALVHGFHILRETVDDSTSRVSVEPSHRGPNDAGGSMVVEGAREAARTPKRMEVLRMTIKEAVEIQMPS